MGAERRATDSAPTRYRPRRPSESVLYRCVQEHLETWHAQCRDGHGDAWEPLLARIYEVFTLVCPRCGAEMRIIAFITDPSTIRDILPHVGEPTTPPRIPSARVPPLWQAAAPKHDPAADPLPPPIPAFEFDQRLVASTVTVAMYDAGQARACRRQPARTRPPWHRRRRERATTPVRTSPVATTSVDA